MGALLPHAACRRPHLLDQSLPALDRSERAAIYDEMNRVIARLHSVDMSAPGLRDYGKAGNIHSSARSAAGANKYRASETERVEAMDRLIEWLPKHIPCRR